MTRDMRMDALLSRYGYCSRRESALWIKKGRVTVRGSVVRSPSVKAEPEEVLVDGEPIPFINGICVALNKPTGYTCSHRESGRLVYELLPPEWQKRGKIVSTVGRLDKETSGLLLLTDDGDFLHRMTSPRHHVPKVYAYETSASVPPEAVELFASGSFALDGEEQPCLPAVLEPESSCTGRMTLTEGRYHQVRRMLAAVGAPVVRLERVEIGALRLVDLALQPGEWVEISPSLFA